MGIRIWGTGASSTMSLRDVHTTEADLEDIFLTYYQDAR